MSVWKNITKHVLTCQPHGPGLGPNGKPRKATKVKPGEMLTLGDEMDYLIGTQIAADQVQKWDAATGKPFVASEEDEDEDKEDGADEEDEA